MVRCVGCVREGDRVITVYRGVVEQLWRLIGH